MGKLEQLFCRHKEKEEYIGDFVKYHWVEDEAKHEEKPTYELREGRIIQTTCKRCGKKWSVLHFNVLKRNLTDFNMFGKVTQDGSKGTL